MIYVGLDDTDTLDDPGTNQLARHLVRELSDEFVGQIIVRHQLLEDPRVPCTRKNGCASIVLEAVGCVEAAETHDSLGVSPKAQHTLHRLIDELRSMIIPWCPAGSDPGLCVTERVPPAVIEWGKRCKRELVTQSEARQIAAEHDICLEGLGGTQDGVIGALAAVGLLATRNDGRVVYLGSSGEDLYDITGTLSVESILARGISEILDVETGSPVTYGAVEIGKRLRPNYRDGRVVLYAARRNEREWEAVRVT
jgi:tRNA(Ile2) C34 agmatinyltransferase TiaS